MVPGCCGNQKSRIIATVTVFLRRRWDSNLPVFFKSYIYIHLCVWGGGGWIWILWYWNISVQVFSWYEPTNWQKLFCLLLFFLLDLKSSYLAKLFWKTNLVLHVAICELWKVCFSYKNLNYFHLIKSGIECIRPKLKVKRK